MNILFKKNTLFMQLFKKKYGFLRRSLQIR